MARSDEMFNLIGGSIFFTNVDLKTGPAKLELDQKM